MIDHITATERIHLIERNPIMRKPTFGEFVIASILIAITITGGFGLYQDIRGVNENDNSNHHLHIIKRSVEKTNA